MLRDPQKRAAYDRYGEAGLRGGGGGGFHHVDLSEALGIFMRDFGGFGGLEELFGGAAVAAAPRAGADVKVTMPLTLAEVATGVEKKINAQAARSVRPLRRAAAPSRASKPQTCATCSGSGEVRRAQRSFFGQFVTVAPCPTCQGEGTIVADAVQEVRGEGRVARRARDHGRRFRPASRPGST